MVLAGAAEQVRTEIVKSKVTIMTILPAAVPEDVAREILTSCRLGRPEGRLLKGPGLIGALEQGLPAR